MIQLTSNAIAQIKKQLEERQTPDAYLRLGVRSGGCSGFTTVIQFEDAQHEKDTLIEIEGIKVLIDKKSLSILDGATLDHHSSLMKQGFSLTNPKETSKCGCGKSFSI
jgi:iron-sulfur cluster assembly protein